MCALQVFRFFDLARRFGAGPEQTRENPLGKRGLELHQWFFGTRTYRAMTGEAGGSNGVDEAFAHRSMAGFGAFILGRNMFGPFRGRWPDDSRKGWWGDNPPSRADLRADAPSARSYQDEGRHYLRPGGAGSGETCRRRSRREDRGRCPDIRTVRQYLRAGVIDELHFALCPVVLGQGEAMFAGIDLPALGYRVTEHQATDYATHIVLSR